MRQKAIFRETLSCETVTILTFHIRHSSSNMKWRKRGCEGREKYVCVCDMWVALRYKAKTKWMLEKCNIIIYTHICNAIVSSSRINHTLTL